MPSSALLNHLDVVLADAEEIDRAHRELRTGNAGRQYGLGALNRAMVVMCVSAWETYVEEVTKETLDLLRPTTPHLGVWPSHNASVRSLIGRFNNPNVQNTKNLIRECMGLGDVTQYWTWQGSTDQRACERLDEAIRLRHEIAHGVIPRPIIHNQQYASRLPGFFRKLGTRTDFGISAYLGNVLAINTGW